MPLEIMRRAATEAGLKAVQLKLTHAQYRSALLLSLLSCHIVNRTYIVTDRRLPLQTPTAAAASTAAVAVAAVAPNPTVHS